MSKPDVLKRIAADGRIEVTAGNCRFLLERIRPGAMLVTVDGMDLGQFGEAVLDEFRLEMMRAGRLALFVNALGALDVSVEVRRQWSAFIGEQRDRLAGVHVLVGSKYVQLVVGIAQHLSGTGNLIQIHSDANLFHERLVRA